MRKPISCLALFCAMGAVSEFALANEFNGFDGNYELISYSESSDPEDANFCARSLEIETFDFHSIRLSGAPELGSYFNSNFAAGDLEIFALNQGWQGPTPDFSQDESSEEASELHESQRLASFDDSFLSLQTRQVTMGPFTPLSQDERELRLEAEGDLLILTVFRSFMEFGFTQASWTHEQRCVYSRRLNLSLYRSPSFPF